MGFFHVILLALIAAIVAAIVLVNKSAKRELAPNEQVKPLGPFVLAAVLSIPAAAVVIFLINTATSGSRSSSVRSMGNVTAIVIGLVLIVAAFLVLIARSSRNATVRRAEARVAIAAPLGYTSEGQPIYPVVGYTPDGRPVTADRAPGVRGPGVGTNGLAIAALVCAFVAPIVGVILGFVARSQINRTGQDGSGMALAGIIIGLLVTLANVALLVAVFHG